MVRKLTSCKTELRISYSNLKQIILNKIRKKTIYIELKNTFAQTIRTSVLKKWSECHKKTSISPFGLLISLHLTKELSWNILSAKILTSTFFNSKFYVVFSYTQAIKKYFLGPTYKKTSSTEQLKSVSEILVKFNLLLIIPCRISSQCHTSYHSFHYRAVAEKR